MAKDSNEETSVARQRATGRGCAQLIFGSGSFFIIYSLALYARAGFRPRVRSETVGRETRERSNAVTIARNSGRTRRNRDEKEVDKGREEKKERSPCRVWYNERGFVEGGRDLKESERLSNLDGARVDVTRSVLSRF